MLRFESFASGSAGNLYRVAADGHAPLLIEAGVAYKALQRATGFQVTSLAGCLVSHAHGDHSRSVRELLAAGVTVYASPETGETLRITDHHNFAPVLDGKQVDVGGWTVLAFDLVHDVHCQGFLIQSKDGEKVLYVSDTAYCHYRFEGVSIAAIEANYSRGILDRLVEQGTLDQHHAARVIRNHMSLEHAAQLLQTLAMPSLREVHLLHLSGGNSDEADFQRQIERIVGVPVYLAPERSRDGVSA